MSPNPSRNNARNRSFAQQHRAIQDFVIDAVDSVLSQLESVDNSNVIPAVEAEALGDRLHHLLRALPDRHSLDAVTIVNTFMKQSLADIVELARHDFLRYPIQDPALSNLEEVFYGSNGFWATVAYRLAHALRELQVPVIPRAISGFAHSKTGIDIHPGATIGPGLFIDHGTGIAIGCTAVLHENVSLYNGVVLGTRSKPTKDTDEHSGGVQKRHPTIGAGVSLYTNAFVGGDITVGENAIVGAYAFVTHDVPPGVAVKGQSEGNRQKQRKATKERDALAAQQTRIRPQDADVFHAEEGQPAVLSLIGNTPVIELRNLHHNPRVKIYAKLEGANPSGSVKDRIALSLVEQAEASGDLRPGKVILESTSGNTGIGLAMVGAAKGYRVVLTMSSAMSEERKKVARAFGATLVETDPTQGTSGAIEAARKMLADEPEKYWMAHQHSSPNNPLAHYEHTAEEILTQIPNVTHFVAGIGTFGTLRGAGVKLREMAGTKVIGIEPVLGQAIQGLRNMKEPNAPELYDESLLDAKIMAMAEDAHATTRLLAEKEGLLVGMSSGAAMHGAIQLAESLEEGTIVVLFPDRGEKYLSTSLFDTPEQWNSMENESDDAFNYQI